MKKSTLNVACIVCNKQASEFHHLKTRKSGGPDEDWNLLPICRLHHVHIHAEGLKKIAAKYPALTTWLTEHGWALDGDGRKWRYKKPEGNQ
jgi:hypothetical protein